MRDTPSRAAAEWLVLALVIACVYWFIPFSA